MSGHESIPIPPLITQQSELEDLCRRWRRAGCLAFDTEFIRDETYHAALCLVQVADEGGVSLIDPTAGVDLAPFWGLVIDPQVTKVVHAGKEDFEIALRATGQPPRNVFDVQIAAGLVGHGYPLSLVRLVQVVLERRIAKGHTMTDWLRRPLTPAQLRYAVEDVAFLPAAHQRLAGELERLGRTGWAREEFERFSDPAFYDRPIEQRAVRLKGAGRLDARGLAVLEALLEWRDRWARQRNRPTRALIRDDILVEIARRRPTRAEELEVLRGFPQARNPRVIAELLTLIAEASRRPAPTPPPRPHERDDSPMLRAVLDLVSAATRAICHEEGVSYDLLGGTQRLRELLDYHRQALDQRPALLAGWREQFIGRRLLGLLEGRAELHLTGWPDRPRLAIVAAPRQPARVAT